MTVQIDNLANLMRSMREDGRKFVLMLGAGGSLSSGVKHASEIVRELLERFGQAITGSSVQERFEQLWKRTSVTDRETLLKPYLDYQPSAGYGQLARLIEAGYFDLAISFNFDSLLERALEAIHFRDYRLIIRGEISDEAMSKLVDAKEPRFKLLKLHESLRSDHFLFPIEEMHKYAAATEALVRQITSNDIIVCGYAFQDYAVLGAFAEQGGNVVCVNPAGVPRNLRPFLRARRSENLAIEADFDSFFEELHRLLLQPKAERELLRPSAERDLHRPAARNRTASRGRVIPPAPEGPYRDDAHAVVIGINRYLDSRIPPLRFARADAEAMYQVLTDPNIGRFNPENVTLLLDEGATERGIRSAIGTQLPKRAGKEHTVLVYYAGHGAPVIDPRAKSADGMEKYLVPHDAHADDLRSSAIPMDAIQQFFSWIDASQVLFFLDSCYSGVAGGRSFEQPGFQRRAMLSDEFLQHLGDEGRFVVTACGPNEVSLETPTLGHGLFTHYLVEGLRGGADDDHNGLVTIDELYDYVYRNVTRAARELGGSMNPIRKGSVRGTIYLAQYETESRRLARDSSTQASAAYDRGNLDEAARLWEQAEMLDPDHESARVGLAAVAERRAREDRQRQEQERKKQEVLRRKQRVLLDHRLSGALSVQHFSQAMDLLERETEGLAGRDRHIRTFVDHLTNGEIGPAQYARSVDLLLMDAGSAVEQHFASDQPPGTIPQPGSQLSVTVARSDENRSTIVPRTDPVSEAEGSDTRHAGVKARRPGDSDAEAERGATENSSRAGAGKSTDTSPPGLEAQRRTKRVRRRRQQVSRFCWYVSLLLLGTWLLGVVLEALEVYQWGSELHFLPAIAVALLVFRIIAHARA